MLEFIINEKSVFVDPSHTFCLSRYHASEGFGLFSDNTHTLCAFLKVYVQGDKFGAFYKYDGEVDNRWKKSLTPLETNE